ncbi:tRNA (5-methylaminomethyl-2-thiouridylate)-methyltransferase, putative [Candida dubliniensis CD36]|uniref:tRNA-5-taurinomethyluridine 2-sulfurtransferase n=1 Tax=Candida dubliniensis (strain CD36 / ATCC MYA-646 / CBS 7987 / NCPF 3949 / NRRL Y-17841) TaxID=573826 RepID=B9WA49_CANDC|nr:tRNA (5-methylaminomethyl-2-thiouridylate)-methyltransferase, putative [Candida dubliniensis CD36]CAX45687.1 tRNA (5-methylaminomethyl-2-thiouridylate)-methyltransferase, putative [Candida dubliniensis CD36]
MSYTLLPSRHSLRALSGLWHRFYTTAPSPYYPVHKPYTPPTSEPVNTLSDNKYTQPTPKPDDHIIVAMSSGVDSSVCAALFKDYPNVHGLYMANWSQSATCTERDWKDVQRVCRDLGISSCERVNFEHEYWHDVFVPMIEKYEKGLTPNPDIGCNKFVKFGKLIDYLHEKYDGKDWWLVTGHYARIMKHNETGEYHLLRGLSQRKDQSYYLSSIPPRSLSKILLPIGHYIKPQIRKLAHDRFQLHTATKPDSQGLCFVNPQQSNFREFLNDYIPENPGDIVTEDGKVWGRHKGLWHATIGQKSSVCMPQADPKYQGIWFVSDKNYEKNQIIIVKGHDNPRLFKQTVELTQLEWLCPKEEVIHLRGLQFQYHSLSKSIPVKRVIDSGDKLVVELETPVRALAPGQAGVLYNGNRVLGGGMISRTM